MLRQLSKSAILFSSLAFLFVIFLSACGPAENPEGSGQNQEFDHPAAASQEEVSDANNPSENPKSEESGDEKVSEPSEDEKVEVDPDRAEFDRDGLPIGFTEDGHPYMGDPSAEIVIKEFSDFQCPFCTNFVNQTLPVLEEDLISNGTAVLIFYDFPLSSIHPQAEAAANAARCAGEQGAQAFWDMHDQLFANASEWSVSDPFSIYSDYAADMGLDVSEFESCFLSDRYTDAISADVSDGTSYGIDGTPSFLINDQLLVGAQPTDIFLEGVNIVQNGGQLTSILPEEPEQQPAVAPTPAAINSQYAAAMGDPSAPVTIVEFTDYQCPYCSRYSEETMPLIVQELIDTGRVYYMLKDLPLEQLHPNAYSAAVAARCGGELGDYWSLHDEIFRNQAEWSGSSGAELNDYFTTYSTNSGLDGAAFSECLSSGSHDAAVEDNMAEARGLGIGGTPHFFVDGYPLNGARPFEHFEYAVSLAEEGRLAEAFTPQEPEPAGPQEIPTGDSFSIGDEDAPITIIEYTDYQCPFCLRHFEQTFPQIIENYVNTGVVRYVFKDFPLTNSHPQAAKAAEAARCANDQDHYLEMHDLLFVRQNNWGIGDPSAIFTEYAEELNLDAELFGDCLSSGEHSDAVSADLNEGISMGVTGTPAFFINGYLVSGAQPYSLFEQAVATLLEREE